MNVSKNKTVAIASVVYDWCDVRTQPKYFCTLPNQPESFSSWHIFELGAGLRNGLNTLDPEKRTQTGAVTTLVVAPSAPSRLRTLSVLV